MQDAQDIWMLCRKWGHIEQLGKHTVEKSYSKYVSGRQQYLTVMSGAYRRVVEIKCSVAAQPCGAAFKASLTAVQQ